MKTKYILIIKAFHRINKLHPKNSLEKILVEFPIPFKDDSNTFKKFKKAAEYFYSANTRTKRLSTELDSTTIYIAIREYQNSITLDRKNCASYRRDYL